MTEMTAIERVNKHINLEEPDRVGIAPMGEFYYAQLLDMSIADFPDTRRGLSNLASGTKMQPQRQVVWEIGLIPMG